MPAGARSHCAACADHALTTQSVLKGFSAVRASDNVFESAGVTASERTRRPETAHASAASGLACTPSTRPICLATMVFCLRSRPRRRQRTCQRCSPPRAPRSTRPRSPRRPPPMSPLSSRPMPRRSARRARRSDQRPVRSPIGSAPDALADRRPMRSPISARCARRSRPGGMEGPGQEIFGF